MLSKSTFHSLRFGHTLNGYEVLNTEAIISRLDGRTGSAGKKRAISPTVDEGRRKRARLSAAGEVSEDDMPSEEIQEIPVYRHILELEYDIDITSQNNDPSAGNDGNAEETETTARLARRVTEHISRNGPQPVDLGTVVFQAAPIQRRDRQVTLAAYSEQNADYLLALPTVSDEFDMAAHDLRLAYLSDPLIAYQTLCSSGRTKMSTHLALYPIEDVLHGEFKLLPFRLKLEIEVSLLCPAIFEPIAVPSHGRLNDIGEAQRRIFWQLFPSRTTPPAWFRGAIDVPLLFSSLGPAPRLISAAMEEAVQPDGLVPTLLPFQRRSVAWMLSREGKTLTRTGSVVPKAPEQIQNEHALFWEDVQLGERETWYLNRVHGVLCRGKPEEEEPLGGILAEEPGLGKTLECIALMLLNPSIDRTPSNKRWDREAKLHVKEIKTTLIVTPPSLAPQWVDELKLHAPSLNVLVYDGWQKVAAPIAEAAVAVGREKRSKTGGRSTEKAQATGSQSSTASRRTAKGRDEVIDLDSNMDVDEIEGIQTLSAAEAESDDGVMDWCTYVNTFDVCITTYNVLQRDLGVARPPPTRPRRANVQYNTSERSRSPLVMCEWYRVIMDEVQMVGSGKAEEMVSLIPRLSSFAVSGTPARTQVADLIHVLRFLRVPLVPRTWTRLLQPAYVNEFVSLFRRYTIRTMKSAVSTELTIPPQTRYLVPIELGRIERHVYDQNFENALLELGLDARGIAVREDWEADTATLRSWLRKLRGICTHPQVGQLLNQGDKLHKPGVLKTIGEVLEDMRDQNWRTLMEDCRNKVQLTATIAQLLQQDDSVAGRYRFVLDTLLSAEKEARQLVEEIKFALEEHAAKGKVLRVDAEKARLLRKQQPSQAGSKGKSRAASEDATGTDTDDEGIPHNGPGEEHISKRSALQNRLRDCRITLHKVLFLRGDVYHVLGASYADSESEAYAEAEDLRRLLLKATEDAAARAMTQLSHNPSVKALVPADLYIQVPVGGKGGIRSADLTEEVDKIIEGLLNEQSTLLWQWREKLIALLTQSLTSKEDDADGHEYARSLDTQGEAEVYLEAYAAILADRRESLTSERTLLAAHEVKETRTRHTKAAMKALETVLEQEDDEFVPLERLGSEELMPEHEVLRKSLRDERRAISEGFDTGRAVKSIMVDLQNIVARIQKEDDPEKTLVRNAVKRLRSLLSDQAKLMDRFQSDLVQLRKAFNERISYFRQLQEISDTVAEVTWEGDVTEAVSKSRVEQSELGDRIIAGRARQRYLDHLASSREEGSADEDAHCCILCRCEFSRGYITQCAHVYCEACLKAWLARKEGRVCPVCRAIVDTNHLQRFSLKSAHAMQQAPGRIVDNEPVPKSLREIDYNLIDPAIYDDILAMESLGSYGSKIQTLVRHLLYLQMNDPGSKSIIFSAWADSLHIIHHALHHNGIECLRIDQNAGKQNAAKRFRTDPNISVLLLHGERENAGLNITCASRVFLVESVVNHAFELQAIARIDRMGQTRPTEVFCYYAEETVEENILDLAARQGQSLYTKDRSVGTLNTTPFMTSTRNIDFPAKKMQKGDFVFKTDDMLAIFFPHMFEDIEYLLGPEETTKNSVTSSPPDRPEESVDAIAGPSRVTM